MACVADVSKRLKILSVESRLQVLQLLKGRALCVGALAARLDVTQGAVSQHLRVLREAGLVVAEKRGSHVHYRLNEEVLAEWRGIICDLLTLDPADHVKRGRAGVAPCPNRSSK